MYHGDESAPDAVVEQIGAVGGEGFAVRMDVSGGEAAGAAARRPSNGSGGSTCW
jgi:hypothetical protein